MSKHRQKSDFWFWVLVAGFLLVAAAWVYFSVKIPS